MHFLKIRCKSLYLAEQTLFKHLHTLSNNIHKPVLGSTKHNEDENDVFKYKYHLFWTLLMELILKVHLKLIIVIMNFLSIHIIMIASAASITFIFKIPGGIHEGAKISPFNAIKW